MLSITLQCQAFCSVSLVEAVTCPCSHGHISQVQQVRTVVKEEPVEKIPVLEFFKTGSKRQQQRP